MRKELTVRGLIIGVIITFVFTAANVYFGLKAGLTFSTSIPAAVISMAVLRGFRDATIQENNIVQTIASAAGTLSSIIFVLPGLIMIGWWTEFPFWISFWICALGGILGVMYSIPLRRALVTTSDLPYPEGVACAEVLKVGSSGGSEHAHDIEHGRAGLLAVLWGSIVSALFAVIVATQLFAADVAKVFRLPWKRDAVTGFDFFLSFALLGIGHLVGLSVGIAMLIGALIGWGWGVPHFSPMIGDLTMAAGALAQKTWSTKVRFIGAGAIGVSAIWTLLKLVQPVTRGLTSAMAASRARKAGQADTLPITERDIPIGIVGVVTLVCMLPIGWLLGFFGNQSGLGAHLPTLIIGGVAYIVLMSFFVSAVCGYMAGLIGSSNSPLSGIGILVVIGAALLLVIGVKPYVGPDASKALIAFALFTTAVIFNVAAIANNNLQDLKTGQLVDATPWKQQAALIIGVVAGAFVIPPVLGLVNQAYGFVGAPGADLRPNPLPAPQAGLISSLAQGVIAADIDWSLIRIGALIGVGIIVFDEILARTTKHMRVPPLAVGLGIYLPTQSTLMIVVGAVVGWLFDQRADRTPKPEATKQLGVLLASGLIVGEGIIGVVISAIVVFSGKDFPLSVVGPAYERAGIIIGGVAFALVAFALYRWVVRLGSAHTPASSFDSAVSEPPLPSASPPQPARVPLTRRAILKAAIKERQAGKPAEEVYKTYQGQVRPNNALAMAIASVADPKRKRRYAVLNYVLVALLVLVAILKALSVVWFSNLSPGLMFGAVILGLIVPLCFALVIARFDGRIYSFLILLLVLNVLNILFEKGKLLPKLPDLLLLAAIIAVAFVVQRKIFPNIRFFRVQKNADGSYVW